LPAWPPLRRRSGATPAPPGLTRRERTEGGGAPPALPAHGRPPAGRSRRRAWPASCATGVSPRRAADSTRERERGSRGVRGSERREREGRERGDGAGGGQPPPAPRHRRRLRPAGGADERGGEMGGEREKWVLKGGKAVVNRMAVGVEFSGKWKKRKKRK